jgi:hypothetical protein
MKTKFITSFFVALMLLKLVAIAVEKSTNTVATNTSTKGVTSTNGVITNIVAAATANNATNDWAFLETSGIRVGIKKSSGGAIAWVSKGGSQTNLINDFDRGRMIQQSYYGAEDGSQWNKQPWMWNPIQGGDWHGNSSKVLELKATTNAISAKTLPRHWASGADLAEVTFEEYITASSNFAAVRYKMTYTGKQSHPERDQEIPAVFINPDLDTLVLYSGDKPWSNGELSRSKPGWPNESRIMTESWAAYVDKNDIGIGVFVPKAKTLTCYRVGDGKPESGSVSYFAPLTKFAITPGKTFEYDVFVIVGTSKEIRDVATMLHKMMAGGPPGFGK